MDGEEEEEEEGEGEGGGEGKNPPISEGIGHWPLWSHYPKKGKHKKSIRSLGQKVHLFTRR